MICLFTFQREGEREREGERDDTLKLHGNTTQSDYDL